MKILVLGATSTIAQEVQKIWAERGYSLHLVARNPLNLQSIAQDLTVRGAKITTTTQDLLQFNKADVFIQDLWAQQGPFDLLFMAHGVLGKQREDEKSAEKTLEILNANLNSHIAYLTPVANLMEATGRGQIAVISSVAGVRGKQSNYIYAAAKAGKSVFLAGLRNRLFPKGIAVTDLKLGFVDTEMTKEFKKGALWASPRSVANQIDEQIRVKADSVYLPKFWWLIMFIINSIPEKIFKRLKM